MQTFSINVTTTVELTGIQNAHMPWTEAGFIDRMLLEYHCGVEGWPRRWPFQNLSSLRGGCIPLREIRDALVSGTLRIFKLTDEQLAEARVNPERFLPNPTLHAQPLDSHRRETYRVIPLVLHPLDLSPISHPLSSDPASESLPEPGPSSVASPLIRIVSGHKTVPRRQRRDIKKRRRQPVTNPDDRPPRRTRRRLGVQTPEYVYDPVPGPSQPEEGKDERDGMVSGAVPSDDYIECFTEVETQSEVESEIESATESWACGSQSEIEDFSSDEE